MKLRFVCPWSRVKTPKEEDLIHAPVAFGAPFPVTNAVEKKKSVVVAQLVEPSNKAPWPSCS